MTTLYSKTGKSCTAKPEQVELMKKAGWSTTKPEVKKDTDSEPAPKGDGGKSEGGAGLKAAAAKTAASK